MKQLAAVVILGLMPMGAMAQSCETTMDETHLADCMEQVWQAHLTKMNDAFASLRAQTQNSAHLVMLQEEQARWHQASAARCDGILGEMSTLPVGTVLYFDCLQQAAEARMLELRARLP